MGLSNLNVLFVVVLVLGYTCAQYPAPVELDLSNGDGTPTQVTTAMLQFLMEHRLFPGASLTVSVTPPPESPDSYLQTVLSAAKFVTNLLLPNVPAQFNIAATKNSDGYLASIQLQIHTATN